MNADTVNTTKQERLQQLVNESELIVKGKVVYVGTPPGFWSGILPALQPVYYHVEEVLKGTLSDKRIEVHHILVKGSATAESGKSAQLSHHLFGIGAYLFVFAARTPEGRWLSTDEHLGTLPATNEIIQQIRASITTK